MHAPVEETILGIIYLYHKVVTWFVKVPVKSSDRGRASVKSASFKFPFLSMRRFEPVNQVSKREARPNKCILGDSHL